MSAESSFVMESEETMHVGEVLSVVTQVYQAVAIPAVAGPAEDSLIDIGSIDASERSQTENLDPTLPLKDVSNSERNQPSQTNKNRRGQKHSRAKSQMDLPVWSKETTDPNTYNLDFTLNPQVQKRAFEGHRFVSDHSRPSSPRPTTPGGNFIRRNIAQAKVGGESKYPSTAGTTRNNSPEGQIHVEELLKYKERYASKTKANEERQEAEVLKECTFRPKVNSVSPPRSFDQLYADMTNFQQQRDEKVARLKADVEESTSVARFPFKPEICRSSERMVAGKLENVFNRLHASVKGSTIKEYIRPLSQASDQRTRTMDSDSEKKPEFNPKINPVSHHLVREGAIGNRLLEDANRRNTKFKTESPRAGSPAPDPKSQTMVESRFLEEMETAIGDESQLNYFRTKEVMTALRLVDANEVSQDLCTRLWSRIANEAESLSSAELKTALLAVMNYPNVPENKQMHSQFFQLYVNRVKPHLPRSYAPDPIVHKTAKSALQQIKYTDQIIAAKNSTEKKVSDMKKTLENEKMKVCTFAPAINTKLPKALRKGRKANESNALSGEYRKIASQNRYRSDALNQLATAALQRKIADSKSHEEIEMERQVTECTFSPSILQERKDLDSVEPPRGAQETIARISKARADTEWRAEVMRKGLPHSSALAKERQQWELHKRKSSKGHNRAESVPSQQY